MTKNGGPAFPFSALSPEGPNVYKDNEGMSLRDYFAAKALQAIVESTGQTPVGTKVPWSDGNTNHAQWSASAAYAYADAMLAAREQS